MIEQCIVLASSVRRAVLLSGIKDITLSTTNFTVISMVISLEEVLTLQSMMKFIGLLRMFILLLIDNDKLNGNRSIAGLGLRLKVLFQEF